MFYAVQSLLQLFPEELFLNTVQKNIDWKVACQQIEDKPKYSYRSFMLDSGRQYQSPEFIKRYINYLSLLKFNKFHWHLTEGQGWRIEIKKYPKLTEIGSQVKSRSPVNFVLIKMPRGLAPRIIYFFFNFICPGFSRV
jgi:hexosaminidase